MRKKYKEEFQKVRDWVARELDDLEHNLIERIEKTIGKDLVLLK